MHSWMEKVNLHFLITLNNTVYSPFVNHIYMGGRERELRREGKRERGRERGRKRGTQRERERHVVGAGNVHKLIGKGLGEIKSNSE